MPTKYFTGKPKSLRPRNHRVAVLLRRETADAILHLAAPRPVSEFLRLLIEERVRDAIRAGRYHGAE